MADYYESKVIPFPAYMQPATGGVDFAAEKDGTYVIERPLTSTLDTKTLRFGLKLENFESLAAPAAAPNNSFTDTRSVKRELLTFTKGVVSPATLDNVALNTATTKIAVELGAAAPADTGTLIDDLDPATTGKFMRYTNTAANISIPDLLVLDVHSLAQIGTYTYTIRVGSETKTITVIVKEPVKKVDLKILAKFDDNNNSNAADAKDSAFKLNATDGKYYATLGFGVGDDVAPVVAHFNVVLSNFTVPSSGATQNTLPFTLSRSLAGLSDSIVERTPVAAGTGNDGLHVSLVNPGDNPNVLINLLTRSIGTVSFNQSPSDANPAATNDSATNLDDWRSKRFSKAGEYVYTLTVDGVTSTLTLVVLENPTLTLNSATFKGTTTAVPQVAGNYVIEEGKTAQTLVFDVTGKSLPTGDLFYKVFDANLATTSANVTEDFYVANFGETPSAIEGGAKSLSGLTGANALPKLGSSVEVVYAAKTSAFSDLTNAIRRDLKVIGIYKAGTTAGSYTLVGFKEVEILVTDVVSNA